LSIVPEIMKGVFAAVLTPLHGNLAPDHGRMARHCRWLLANGCDGLAILGTTGESTSFSAMERMEILEGLAVEGIPLEKSLPGTGAAAFTDSVEITRHALSLGVGGVLMLPPFYFKGVHDDGVFAAYAEIIERIGDPALKVYLYNFPQMSGVPLSLDVIGRLIDRYPETVVGAKDSSGDIGNMLAMVERFPGFAVFPGSEAVFLEALQAGGAGCITAVSNVSSPVAQRVYSAWTQDHVVDEDANNLLVALRTTITAYPLSAGLKALMARHTDDAGWERVRPTLTSLDDTSRDELFDAVDQTGYSLPTMLP
jgi:4-hydroxy-tetrahydrodipicolinate synthase